MNLVDVIKEINRSNTSAKDKIIKIKNLIQYYYKLKKGISTKSIFENQDVDLHVTKKLANLIENIECQTIEDCLSEIEKNYLKNLELKNQINFKEKRDFLQVGINTIFLQEPFKGLWTTGKAKFYFPFEKNQRNSMIIEVFSIIPNTIKIGQENKILETISCKKLETKRIKVPLQKTENGIVEIFVDVNKKWMPNVIDENQFKIPMGINIQSMTLIQE